VTYVITQACCNDASCVPVCPVNCIHPTPDEPDYATAEMLYIDPVGCIDCGACVSVCPVGAISADFELEPELAPFEALNAAYFRDPEKREYDPHPIDPPARSWTAVSETPLRVAVVGSGPAGFYVAEELLTRRGLDVQVDMFERLTAPTGLVRYGVAPDHQETKSVSDGFARTMRRAGFRLFLDVEVGRDVTHEDLVSRYHAVVYAAGASGDRRLGVPGEDLPGSLSATAFVGWYNGHPDHHSLPVDLSHPRAVVVGNGNVALDVARVLLSPLEDLRRTDIAEHALVALEHSAIREVVVLGRRGPVQAAFSVPELLGLDRVPGVDLRVHRNGSADVTRGAEPDHTIAAYKADLLADIGEPMEHDRSLVLRFQASPVEIVGTDRVEGVRIVHNSLVADDDGDVTAVATDVDELLDCGLVLRAVGYLGRELPGIPFDHDRGVIPNIHGRVTDSAGHERVTGVYVTGWIKRGPSGVIGTNKQCAQETVAALLEDLETGRLVPPTEGSDVTGLVSDSLGVEAWKRVDAHERSTGRAAGRARAKLVDRGLMRQVGRGSADSL
jgi:ferredoxin--NADP+ reductase